MTPIKSIQPKKPSYIHKVLGLKVKSNAIVELHNLISHNKWNLTMISVKDISQIENRYDIRFDNYFKKERKEIFHRFLEHYLEYKRMDENAVDELKHLSKLLMLKKSECRKEVDYVCAEIYHAKVEKLLKEGEIEYGEQEKVNTLKKNLFLSDLKK